MDDLCGLPNRRAFSADYPQFVEAADDGLFMSVAIMDIDNFKASNDRYGHAAGDLLLRRTTSSPRLLVLRYSGVPRIQATCSGRSMPRFIRRRGPDETRSDLFKSDLPGRSAQPRQHVELRGRRGPRTK